jgi:hypothetical protein
MHTITSTCKTLTTVDDLDLLTTSFAFHAAIQHIRALYRDQNKALYVKNSIRDRTDKLNEHEAEMILLAFWANYEKAHCPSVFLIDKEYTLLWL